LRDIPQNYALTELVEAEQKLATNLEKEIATNSLFFGDSCGASTIDNESDIGSQGDEHLSYAAWLDKIATIKDDLDKLKGFDARSKLENILSNCYRDIELLITSNIKKESNQ
jgi:hypothetical protein